MTLRPNLGPARDGGTQFLPPSQAPAPVLPSRNGEVGEGKWSQMPEGSERREEFKKSMSMTGGGRERTQTREQGKDSEKAEGTRGGRRLRKGELSRAGKGR